MTHVMLLATTVNFQRIVRDRGKFVCSGDVVYERSIPNPDTVVLNARMYLHTARALMSRTLFGIIYSVVSKSVLYLSFVWVLIGWILSLGDLFPVLMPVYHVINDCVRYAVQWCVRMSCICNICLNVQYMITRELNVALSQCIMMRYMMMQLIVLWAILSIFPTFGRSSQSFL